MPYGYPDEMDPCLCSICRRERALMESGEYDDESGDSGEYEYAEPYRSDRVIQYHGYKPRPVFYGEGPMYLGMELEVECPDRGELDSWAREVQARMGESVYIQEDSSINYGFEITTHPMSYSWAMENFAWNALKYMKDKGFSTHSRVGIHVHVSRTGFASECHLYRWMKFVYRNEAQVSRLARRRKSDWASFDPHFRAQVKRYVKKEDYLRGYTDDRYQAINPNNPNTLEVRVFASSLRSREVKAALAFVASTVEYTRHLDANAIIRGNGWAWSSYVEWLRQHDEYRPLMEELEALTCVS